MKDGPKDGVAYHFRYATRGKIVEKNAHPFVIGNDFALMHNGTITNIKANTEESDSSIFAKGLEKYYNEYGNNMFFDRKMQSSIEEIISSKVGPLGFGCNDTFGILWIGTWLGESANAQPLLRSRPTLCAILRSN